MEIMKNSVTDVRAMTKRVATIIDDSDSYTPKTISTTTMTWIGTESTLEKP